MMSQLTLVVAGVVVIDPGTLTEGLGLTGVPRATWLIPELLEPAWNAITAPITRPSATATASWTVIRGTPLPCVRRRHAGQRPLCTHSASTSAVPLFGGITLDQPGGMMREIKKIYISVRLILARCGFRGCPLGFHAALLTKL